MPGRPPAGSPFVALMQLAFLFLHCDALFAQVSAPSIREVLQGVAGQKGILVHLGSRGGERSLQLHSGGQFTVQGLDRSQENVAEARRFLLAQKAYGPVSFNVLNEETLPYTTNLINVLVVDDASGISREEMLRVLRPLGTAWIALSEGQGWEKLVKPWPDSLDEWTHFLHDASGNAVSKDKEVGPPRRLQWTAGPLWTRSHEFNNSMPAMVTALGRMFYIFDYGLTGMEDERLPEKWTLVARDAFNGSLLWERDLSSWGSHQWDSRALRFFRGNMARRLVSDGERVFITFDYGKGVEILDASTGSSLGQVPGTEGAEEILVEGNQMFAISQLEARRPDAQVVITCYDLEAGANAWQFKGEGHFTAQLSCVAEDVVVYHSGQELICIDRQDGQVRWQRGLDKQAGGPDMLLVAEGKLVMALGSGLQVLSLTNGETLWTTPRDARTGSMREYDMFVTRGKIFVNSDSDLIAGYDLETGEKLANVDPRNVQSQGHHLRCYRAKATEDFLITQFRGVEFLSLDENVPSNQNDWLRGSCTYGVMPANGFLYQPPHSCFCFAGAMQRGFNAFASLPKNSPETSLFEDRPGPIEKGAAYGFLGDVHSGDDAWRGYRHDQRRTGATQNKVAGSLTPRWTLDFGSPTTQPVGQAGRVFVAVKDHHTLYAIDNQTGERIWEFACGGPIDSSPTLHRGLLVFGSSDGYAYCVRAQDGQLSWRRRLAPAEQWMTDEGRLESVWRLHGSLPVVGDLAYCIAGRSSFLDGGLFLTAIDIQTGEIKHRTNLYTATNEREDRKRNKFVAAYHIEGAHSDLLVAQGDYIFLNQMKFSHDLKLQPTPYLSKEQITARPSINLDDQDYVNDAIFKVKWRNITYDTYDKLAGILVDENETVGERETGLHLFTTSGFLDTSFFNRSYWMYAKTWPGFNHTNLAPKSGQLLVVGPKKTYALKAFTERYALSPSYTPGTKGYLVVADDNDNEPTMDPRAWGKDKGMGFSRGAPPIWHHWLPVRVQAMVLGGDKLFVCGPPDVLNEEDPLAAFEGRLGSELWALSAEDGSIVSQQKLDEMPLFDGLMVANDCLYLSTTSGKLICMGGNP